MLRNPEEMQNLGNHCLVHMPQGTESRTQPSLPGFLSFLFLHKFLCNPAPALYRAISAFPVLTIIPHSLSQPPTFPLFFSRTHIWPQFQEHLCIQSYSDTHSLRVCVCLSLCFCSLSLSYKHLSLLGSSTWDCRRPMCVSVWMCTMCA